MNSVRQKSLGIALIMILVASLTRFIPHYPNFTALGGIALFSTAFISRKSIAFLAPLLALFLSDLVLNNMIYAKMYPEFYNGFTIFAKGSGWVYLGFGAVMLIGHFLLTKKNMGRFILSSIVAAVAFFLITNIGTWAGPWSLAPKTFSGLLSIFALGVPFFWSTLAGNLFFGAILFGVYQWIEGSVFASKSAVQPSHSTRPVSSEV